MEHFIITLGVLFHLVLYYFLCHLIIKPQVDQIQALDCLIKSNKALDLCYY